MRYFQASHGKYTDQSSVMEGFQSRAPDWSKQDQRLERFEPQRESWEEHYRKLHYEFEIANSKRKNLEEQNEHLSEELKKIRHDSATLKEQFEQKYGKLWQQFDAIDREIANIQRKNLKLQTVNRELSKKNEDFGIIPF